jgi:putative DNA primase/helicase
MSTRPKRARTTTQRQQRQQRPQRHQRQQRDDRGEDTRPTVVITNGDAHTDILRQIYSHLPARPWIIYQKDGALVRTTTTVNDGTAIERLCPVGLASIISGLVRLKETVTTSQSSFVRGVQPPTWLLREMLAQIGVPWNPRIVPQLDFVSEGPLFVNDPPRILTTNGYNEQAKVLVVGCPKTANPNANAGAGAGAGAAERPEMTLTEAIALLRATLAEFPFESDADRAAAIAMCLTPVARAAIKGPLPLFVIDGFESGQGKTALADLAVLFAQTRRVRAVTWPRNPEEIEKKIGSMLVGNGRVHVWDNITGAFGGDTLDALLTSDTFATRELGKSSMIQAKNTAMWIAGGNNVVLQGDLVRRLVLIRFKAHDGAGGHGDMPPPASERVFQNKDLLVQASQPDRRYRLLYAAATILRAFHVGGHAATTTALSGSMVSYSAWSDIVRHAAAWSAGVDPLLSQRSLSQSLRQQSAEGASAVAVAWFKWKGMAPAALSEVAGSSSGSADVREAMRPFGWSSTDATVMHRLRQSFPRQFVASRIRFAIPGEKGTFRFERREKKSSKVQQYMLVRQGGGDDDTDGDPMVDDVAAGCAGGAGGIVPPPCDF